MEHDVNNIRGLTLLELMLVVLIIAIFSGGYEVAVELVESVRKKSIILEIEKIKTAVNSFRIQYHDLPGDIPNASAYWPNDYIQDGNGDGEITWSINKTLDESLTVWRHLYLAEMFDENLTGLSTGAAGDTQRHIIGVNLPEASMDGTGFLVRHSNVPLLSADRSSDANTILTVTGNYMQWASIWPDATFFPKSTDTLIGGVFNPAEAEAFDTKYDDGLPYSGRIVGEDSRPGNPGAATICTVGFITTSYRTIVQQKTCRMHFYID